MGDSPPSEMSVGSHRPDAARLHQALSAGAAPVAVAAGRSLLNDPAFMALARAYQSRVEQPARARLADVIEGHWYALILLPGSERKAIDRVANDVRLPTYLPMVSEVRANWRGRRRHVRRALFVGYGFVCTADIDALFGRIVACEGVLGVVCEDGGQPAIVHQSDQDLSPDQRGTMGRGRYIVRFDDELIDFIRAIENGEDGILADAISRADDAGQLADRREPVPAAEPTRRRRRRRGGRKVRRRRERIDGGAL